jgi:V8-like Glu-specific endopeptidase
MRPIRTKGFLLAVAVAATAVVAATPAGAAPAAQPAGGTSSSPAALWDPVHGASTARSDADARRIIDAYWTPERTASARSADVAPVAARGAARTATTTAQPEVTGARPAAPTAAAAASMDAWFSNATGKVFFRNASNGGNFVCTASAINSGSKRLVLTAGHCVHGGRGGTWHQNWVFVPGYTNGNRPLGTFPATSLRTFDAWITSSEYTRDVGFVVTGNNAGGSTLVSVAGGHGIAFNAGTAVPVHVAGYPLDRAGGEAQQYCIGTTRAWSPAVPGSQIDCGFGSGASGGPWLRDYQSTGLGTAVSETMGISGATANYGPPFDNAVRDLFNTVKDAS